MADLAAPMDSTRILIVGYGRMGRLVEELASENGCTVAGVLDVDLNANAEALSDGAWGDVDVAIDFTTGDAVSQNLPRYAALHLNAVIGTTGWTAQRPAKTCRSSRWRWRARRCALRSRRRRACASRARMRERR